MPAPVARRGEPNYDMFDRYTLGHGAAGVLLELARVPWWGTLIIAVGWEFAERPLKDALPSLFPVGTQDTTRNALGDVIGVMAGWALARVVSSV